VAVLLVDPDAKRGVVVLGQIHAALRPAGIEDLVLKADLRDRDFRLDQVDLDLEDPGLGVFEPGIETAEAASGERRSFEARARRLLEALVQVVAVDGGKAREAVSFELRPAVPDGLAASAPVFRALPDGPDAPAQFGRGEVVTPQDRLRRKVEGAHL
jgi:hypothetical protein